MIYFIEIILLSMPFCVSFSSYLSLLQSIYTRLPHIVQISMIKILSLLALVILAASYTEENGVLNLAQSDFPAVLQQFPYLMIKFYTPWCGHCKKLAPIYEELAGELATTHPQVKLANIDCEAHPKIQSLYKVQGFPTLFFFKNGKESTFGGPRNKEFMTHWINKKIQDPVIPVEASKLAELEKDGKINVVFYGDLNTPQGTNLINVAKNDDYNMYYNIRTPEKAVGSIEIFRPFGQTVKLDVVDYNIKSWINLYDRPIVYVFDDRTRGEIFTDKKNAILLFEPTGELSETVRAAFRDAAQEWKIQNKKKLIFSGIQSSEEAYKGFTDHIKIDAETHPIVYVKSAEKLKYLYPGNPAEVTAAKIIDFIKGVEAKKVRKYKLEEETRSVKKTEEL